MIILIFMLRTKTVCVKQVKVKVKTIYFNNDHSLFA